VNLGEIITRVQRTFGDDVQAQITKADIVRWVNDACLEIVTNNATNQGYVGTTAVEVGRVAYPLPDDLLFLRSVRLNGRKLKGESYEQLCEMDPDIENSKGLPSHYWVYGENLNLYPIPNEDEGNINILYVKSPDILTESMVTKEPDVPKQYHPRIVEYCIAQAAELDDNLGQYQLKMGQFKENISSIKTNSEQPESDGYYPSITYVGEYDYGSI
jgi:hypothetical protein